MLRNTIPSGIENDHDSEHDTIWVPASVAPTVRQVCEEEQSDKKFVDYIDMTKERNRQAIQYENERLRMTIEERVSVADARKRAKEDEMRELHRRQQDFPGRPKPNVNTDREPMPHTIYVQTMNPRDHQHGDLSAHGATAAHGNYATGFPNKEIEVTDVHKDLRHYNKSNTSHDIINLMEDAYIAKGRHQHRSQSNHESSPVQVQKKTNASRASENIANPVPNAVECNTSEIAASSGSAGKRETRNKGQTTNDCTITEKDVKKRKNKKQKQTSSVKDDKPKNASSADHSVPSASEAKVPSEDKIDYPKNKSVISLQTRRSLKDFFGNLQNFAAIIITPILFETMYLRTVCNPLTDAQVTVLKKRKLKSSSPYHSQTDGDSLAGLGIYAKLKVNRPLVLHILPFGPQSTVIENDREAFDNLSVKDKEEAIRKLLLSRLPIISFRAQHLQRILLYNNVELPLPHQMKILDPSLMTWMTEPELKSYDLKNLLDHYNLTSHKDTEELSSFHGESLKSIISELVDQNTLADHVLPLVSDMKDALTRETWIACLLARMEVAGISFDPSVFKTLARRISNKISEINEEARECLGMEINLGSSVQVSDTLFRHLKLTNPELRDKNKTHASTRDDVLQKLKWIHPLPGLVLRYRHLNKLLSTWIQPLPAIARRDKLNDSGVAIFPHWLNATATGRLSSNSPNIQAAPKAICDIDSHKQEMVIKIRSAFTAREGYELISADYSQMEIRVLAHLSKDEQLISLLHKAGDSGDVFQLMVEWIEKECGEKFSRDHMKRTAYGIIYGQSSKGLGETLDIPIEKAKALIDRFLSFFPGVCNYVSNVKECAIKDGFVKMISQRRRPLPGILSSVEYEKARAERQAVNTIIQGSAADIMKMSMMELSHFKRDAVMKHGRLLAQLHDELIFEVKIGHVKEVLDVVVDVMTKIVSLRVPLRVSKSRGNNWGDMMKVLA